MFSKNKKSPSKKRATVVEEKPLYAQLLPFANVMTEKVQVVNALAFTLIMLFLSRAQMPKYLGAILGFGFIGFYIAYVLNLSDLISVF